MNDLCQGDINSDCPPVLFLIFNRPDLTKQSFAAIREAKPAKLFVAADGPRANREEESELCEQARQIATAVDWPCEFKTLFRDKNLGCEIAVSEAITWFFEYVELGIILEDDCVPNPSFFNFCKQMLDTYYEDNRVMVVTGNNFQDDIHRGKSDYYFSKYPHCWGWATWKRSWSHYDHSMRSSPCSTVSGMFSPSSSEKKYWCNIFRKTRDGHINTWDYRWTYSVWCVGGLTVTPQKNLVQNIGFDPRATHTKQGKSPQTSKLAVKLTSPTVRQNRPADQYVAEKVFNIHSPSLIHTIKTVLRAMRHRLYKYARGGPACEKY